MATADGSRKRQIGNQKVIPEWDRKDLVSKDASLMALAARLMVCVASGVVFGVAIEKGRVYDPLVIQDQMLFKRFIMLKMMLSALLTGMFGLSFISMIPATRNNFLIAITEFNGCMRQKGYKQVALGAVILGMGMAIAGACPGIVLSQVGAGAENAGYTFLGALFGALLYGLMEPVITKLTKPSEPIKRQFLHEEMKTPYFMLSLPLASLLAMLLFAIELYSPWTTEVSTEVCGSFLDEGILSARCWPPYVAGALIGCLQVPILFTVGDTLGSSSSYCTIVSQPFRFGPLQKLSPYLARYQSGLGNWWQVLYIGGAIIGAILSSQTSGTYGTAAGVSPLAAICGGFMLVFGARLAAGCTSGHGLSGTGLLNLLSMTATAAMFAGGIGTAVIRLAVGL